MAEIDKSYHSVVGKIIDEGYEYPDPYREGVVRRELGVVELSHKFTEGFPATTTKALYWKGVVAEALWFLRGDTNIKYLVDNGVNIWNKDAYKFYCRKIKENPKLQPIPMAEFITQIKSNRPEDLDHFHIPGYKFGDLGRVYGAQFRNYGKIEYKPTPIILTDFPKEIECDYTSNKSQLVGTEHDSNNCEKYTVIKEYYIGKNQRFTVQFHKTGFQKEGVTKQNILKTKQIKDIFYPTVYGVATIGDADRTDELYTKLKPTWEGMISRCYNKNDSCYYLYGGKGVYVDNSWLNYANFLRDFVAIEGYHNKLKNWKEYSLDKDVLGAGYYSVDTCLWVSKKTQVEYSRRFKPFTTKLDELSLGIDQITKLVKGMKTRPLATDLLVEAWNPAELDNMALPPCHYGFQVVGRPLTFKERMESRPNNTESQWFTEKTLDKEEVPRNGFTLVWNQRSVDTFLGLPFNIASYATIAYILGEVTGIKPLGIHGSLRKVHIYDNAVTQVTTQLSRDVSKYPNVDLEISAYAKEVLKGKPFEEAINLVSIKDFKLEGYKSYPAITAEMLARD